MVTKMAVAIEYFNKIQNNINTPKIVNIFILYVSTIVYMTLSNF